MLRVKKILFPASTRLGEAREKARKLMKKEISLLRRTIMSI